MASQTFLSIGLWFSFLISFLMVGGFIIEQPTVKGAHSFWEEATYHLSLTYWSRVYSKAFASIGKKLEHLKMLDLENQRLREQNARLLLENASKHWEKAAERGVKYTASESTELLEGTGTASGRHLASMPPVNVPHQMPVQAIWLLGLKAFKAHEDEKAIQMMNEVSKSSERASFNSPSQMLTIAVAWYRLGNLKKSQEQLEALLAKEPSADALSYQAQARLWKALIAKKLNQTFKVEYWLTEFIDHHPHAPEVKWINPESSQSRSPASSSLNTNSKENAPLKEGGNKDKKSSHHPQESE